METEAIPNKRFQFHDMDVAVHRHTFARDVDFGLIAGSQHRNAPPLRSLPK